MKLRKYQKQAVERMVQAKRLALIAEPGTGKTLIVLEVLRRLFENGGIKNALIVSTPRIVDIVWPSEIKKWGYLMSISAIRGSPQKRLKALDKKADIYTINFEMLQWLDAQGVLFDVLIIDELSFLKNTQSKRFKALKKDLPHYEYRFGLTGSPMTRNYEDLFGQIYVIAGEVLGRNITHYRARYFNQGLLHWQRFLRKGAREEIAKRIAPYTQVINLEGNVELPDILYNDVVIDLSPSSMKTYKQMQVDCLLEFEESVVYAANGAAVVGKLQQIANGAVYTVDDAGNPSDAWQEIHTEKITALEELLIELGDEPCLIVYNFRHDLARLKALLGVDTPHIGGGVSASGGAKIVEKWNAGEIKYLLIHPASAGHGLNLQSGPGHTIIWFGLTYDLNFYEQTNKRLHRSGQRNKVMVHHLVCRDTIDEKIIKLLGAKDKEQKQFVATVKILVDELISENRG